jgi:hypothetical protein
MAASSLLDIDSPGFEFDHDQMHRRMNDALPPGSGLAFQWMLDPVVNPQIPAGWWNTNHAQAHANFATAFQRIYWPSAAPIVDINLAQGPTQFWAFQNWNLHNLANSVLPSERG